MLRQLVILLSKKAVVLRRGRSGATALVVLRFSRIICKSESDRAKFASGIPIGS